VVLVACVAAAVIASYGDAQESPLTLSAEVSPRTTTIGTPFRYTLRIESPTEVELLVPLLTDRIGDFIITDFGEVKHDEAPTSERRIIERWYTLVSYHTGDLLIPGVAIQYRDSSGELATDYFPDAPITISSLLESKASSDHPPELRDIKGPVPVPANRMWFWIALAACAVIVAAAGLLWRWSSRARKERDRPAPPAHETALASLLELRRQRLLEDDLVKEYYVRLSAVVREYIEARFDLRAPEMTSDEFLAVAQRDTRLSTTDRSLLQSFLNEADLVKFARHVPSRSDGEKAWNAAREFIEHTAEKTTTDDQGGQRAAA